MMNEMGRQLGATPQRSGMQGRSCVRCPFVIRARPYRERHAILRRQDCLGRRSAVFLRAASARAGTTPKPDQAVALEIGGQRFVYEVIRHLYRWYLDETDIDKHISKPTVSVWLRSVHPPLDPGDKSTFAELWLPALQIRVTLKSGLRSTN